MKVRKVLLEQGKSPPVRVTATYDEETAALLKQTIEKMGILNPVVLTKEGETYWIVDGLHRVQEARASGESHIDAVVYEGSLQENLEMNLVLNKVRGKTKASEMVQVIGELWKTYEMDSDALAAKTGLTRDYIEQLMRISEASPDLREALDQELIGVGAAFQISRLPSWDQQNSVCSMQGVYKLKIPELKNMVDETLRLMANQEPGEPPPPPAPPPPPKCDGCHNETQARYLRPVMICPKCYGIAYQAFKAEPAATEPATTSAQE